MQRLVIIDYGSGNLHSAAKAFERAARESEADVAIEVSAYATAVTAADRVVLPGVGAFADCRRGIDAVPGMLEALEKTVREKRRPFLGICVGAQLMAERGLEFRITPGFGWIKGDAKAIEPKDPTLKIPHMGWNTLDVVEPASAARRHRHGPDRAARLFRALLSRGAGRSRSVGRNGRLRWAGHGHARPGQHRRHPVPPREEPDARPQADRQFPPMATLGAVGQFCLRFPRPERGACSTTPGPGVMIVWTLAFGSLC